LFWHRSDNVDVEKALMACGKAANARFKALLLAHQSRREGVFGENAIPMVNA
jgi:hypothetical protein